MSKMSPKRAALIKRLRIAAEFYRRTANMIEALPPLEEQKQFRRRAASRDGRPTAKND